MAEPDKRQIGDGSDNYGEAARQVARAARESGKMAADQAAAKGAEAAGNAAAATVQAGVEGGKAVAGVAVEIGAGCNRQYTNTYGISASQLLPGDLGFLADGSDWGHVLIFAGYSSDGTRMWVHSASGTGVVLNSPDYEGRLSYRRLSIVDYDAPVA